MAKFRFEDLEIWKLAMKVAKSLFAVANELERKKLFRFAEQLRGSALSMPNNIAEGSGSCSKREFHQFLNIARRSTFETANIVIILTDEKLIDPQFKDGILESLDHLCRKITNFQRALL